MAEEKILVTDLIKEVGTQAMSQLHCEPFIKWVLEKTSVVIDHDVSAILLPEGNKAKFYLWLNQPVSHEYSRECKLKAIEALNAATKSSVLEGAVEVLAFNEGEAPLDQVDKTSPMASFFAVPLIERENCLGLFVISSRKPNFFLAYKLNMFNVFVNQVALAIDSLKAREKVIQQAHIIERDSVNMKLAFSGMSEGLIMTDEFNEVILVNPRASKMLGIMPEQIQAMSKTFILGFLSELFKELANTDKQIVSKDIDLDSPQKMTLRIDATPAKDSKGKKIGTTILLRDITQEKELDRLKTEFISTVSHELRTPLTTIRETVSQVLDGILGTTTDQQREFLSICLDDIDRLTRIINDLLDISKIEARKIQLKPQMIDLVAVVKNVSMIFQTRFREKALEIKTSFNRENISVYADKDKIIQVLTNLVGNSLKFTEKGYVQISVDDKEGFVECSVFDTGRGISEEDLPKVFSKFQQFGRVDGPGERGTGLGLSIAKGIIEMHHGKFSVESNLNEWTKFSFTLPKADQNGGCYGK
jgi:two-component system, OmpR family, phosphate regulon sensor histidine kinase PhoR